MYLQNCKFMLIYGNEKDEEKEEYVLKSCQREEEYAEIFFQRKQNRRQLWSRFAEKRVSRFVSLTLKSARDIFEKENN